MIAVLDYSLTFLRLMIYGSITTGICYLIAAVTLKVADNHPERKSTLSIVTVSMFFLYYFCYGTSFAKVPWVYNSEINSLGWRARGSAAATATNWLGGFVTVQFTKAGVDNLGWGFYLCKHSQSRLLRWRNTFRLDTDIL